MKRLRCQNQPSLGPWRNLLYFLALFDSQGHLEGQLQFTLAIETHSIRGDSLRGARKTSGDFSPSKSARPDMDESLSSTRLDSFSVPSFHSPLCGFADPGSAMFASLCQSSPFASLALSLSVSGFGLLVHCTTAVDPRWFRRQMCMGLVEDKSNQNTPVSRCANAYN